MRINVGTDSEPLTYVEMKKSNATPINAVSSVTPHNSSVELESGRTTSVTTGVTSESGEVGEDTTKLFYQTMTFEMFFDTSDNVEVPKRQNEAFANYDMMSYVFRFIRGDNQQFDVSPSKVERINNGDVSVIRFTLNWPLNMGVLMDKEWTNNTEGKPIECEVYARTNGSNFVYKLSRFHIAIACGCQAPSGCGTEPQDVKDAMDDDKYESGKKHLTHCFMYGSSQSGCKCG